MSRQPTILETAQSRLGFWKGTRTVAFMCQWHAAAQELGREPTVEEYAEVWGTSRRTAFREQQHFRECFPGEATPTRLMDELTRSSRARTPQAVGAMPLPA